MLPTSKLVRNKLKVLNRLPVADRCQAILTLGSEQDADVIPVLLHLLTDRSQIVREHAVEAFVKIGGALSRTALRSALLDPSASVRIRAVEGLAAIGTYGDVRYLELALNDPNWVVRSDVLYAVRDLDGRSTRRLIGAALDDPHPVVRRDAAMLLGSYGDRSLIPRLQQALLSERNSIARSGLLWSLYRLGQRECLKEVLALLHDHDFIIRANAINKIRAEEVAPEDRAEVLEALQWAVEREDNPGRREDALQAIAELERVRGAQPGPSVRSSTPPDGATVPNSDRVILLPEPPP